MDGVRLTVMHGSSFPALPVDGIVPELLEALAGPGVAVLQAPPGSGKTTRVPLAILDAPWLAGGRVVMLEPRRVAARAAARRMAATLGEEVGRRIGYRIRQERRGGAETLVDVVTEGVFTRMLQADPSLEGVGAVIFDEFHERSISADLGLALALDARAGLRPDLRLLVMSATLASGAVASVLGGAPTVTATTVAHPVNTVWVGRPTGPVTAAVARTVTRALLEQQGDILAFLPGSGEIRTVERILRQDAGAALAVASADVMTLSGSLSGAEQDAALRPATAGRRKIVLATSIAETSLTIDGVRTVVDSGLMRVPRFDHAAGMTRLVTLPVSRAAADQRQGRAARQGPGTCYRLWSATDHAGLPRATPPEILVADLAPLALDLAEWGVDDPGELGWIDPPPPGPLAAARRLLAELGALDGDRRITDHGRALARPGVHPRLAHLLVRTAETAGAASPDATLAALVAATLSEAPPRGQGRGDETGADLTARVDAVRRGRQPAAAETARRWQRLLGAPAPAGRAAGETAVVPEDVGRLVALAYPDRVGRARPGRRGHWLLRSGRGAWVSEDDALSAHTWVVAAELDGDRREARIWSGAPLHPDDVEDLFADAMTTVQVAGWDPRADMVVAREERRLGAIVVRSTPGAPPTGDLAVTGLLAGVRALGLDALPWNADVERIRSRVAFARGVEPDEWPDLSDEALMADLGSWLAPWLSGRTRRSELAGVALADALWARIGWSRRTALDALAPTHLVLPTGERRRLEYPAGGPPTLTAKVQELFGTTTTPSVGGGRVPVLLQLTSPAGRPVQMTSDLAGFWDRTYPQIRGELRARYPRHSWPADPRTAEATRRPVPRRR